MWLKSKEEKRSKSIIACGLVIVFFLIKITSTSNKRFPKAKI